jgi:hypothetical protein
MSALVAGPAVVHAAAANAAGVVRWPNAMIAGGAWLAAMGVGTVSPLPLVVGVVTYLLCRARLRRPAPDALAAT